MTTPSRREQGTSVEVSLELQYYTYYAKSTKVLLVKRHIACSNTTELCENYGPYSCAGRALDRFTQEEDGEIVNLADSRVDCLQGCLASLSVLVVRIALLEYSKIHKKAYKFIVYEFGGFKMY